MMTSWLDEIKQNGGMLVRRGVIVLDEVHVMRAAQLDELAAVSVHLPANVRVASSTTAAEVAE
jgi:hypothetical protein